MANISRARREDRAKKEAEEILKRSDESYLEMETFKPYEFTYCIAFEMAKRDPELLKAVNRFILFYRRHKEKITFVPEDRGFFNEAFDFRTYRRAQGAFLYWYDYLAQVFWLKPIDLYYITNDETALEMAENYVMLAYEKEEEKVQKPYEIHNAGDIDFVASVDMKNEHFFQEQNEPSQEDILVAINDYDIDPLAFESKHEVLEHFSRPKLSTPPSYNKNIELELNLSLPKEELIAYIGHIKDKFDKHKEHIKTAAELLGANLFEEGFELSDADTMYKRDRRKTMSEKSGDFFFIYDCYVNNLSMDYSLIQLDRYWNDERKAFSDSFQIKTHRRYLKLARDFIESRKYQSLLLGI